MTVHDKDLVDIAQQWPRLTSFVLIATAGEPAWDAEGPGIRTLEAFKSHCPALERLSLPHLVFRSRDLTDR